MSKKIKLNKILKRMKPKISQNALLILKQELKNLKDYWIYAQKRV